MIHLLGIRHHGSGSARNVLARLEQLQPDLILVEGAPEIDAVTHWIGDQKLIPPVAVLVYNIDEPAQAGFYPFAAFSPEWQAAVFARRNGIPVKMMDAPFFSFAAVKSKQSADHDPLLPLAEIEGFNDSREWWEYRFERQILEGDPAAHFEAVFLAMKNLRDSGIQSSLEEENRFREAFMRRQIRKAVEENYHNIAVVCGAWHAPGLILDDYSEKKDNALLKSLPAVKTKAGVTWIPWTNGRLSLESEYGAGIGAPAWHEFQWSFPQDAGENWLTQVARLFRKKHNDISSAHIIETQRLAVALSALRGRAFPNLNDFNESVISVMCGGDEKVFELIKKDLLVGEKIGAVPDNLPKHPLQVDFEQLIKKNKLKLQPEPYQLNLDLRNSADLQRSILLHRLDVLNIQWAQKMMVRSKGTFRELWQLKWRPTMLIQLIEMGIWGNTVELAAMHLIQHKADETKDISEVAELISAAIPADLMMMLSSLLDKMQNLTALSTDIIEMMSAVPAIADVGRYGSVRKTDLKAMQSLCKGIIERICVGLPFATAGLNEELALKVFSLLRKVNDAIRLLEDEELTADWNKALTQIVYRESSTPLLAGCTCRLLMESKSIEADETSRLLSLALSSGSPVADAAAWMEGFLEGSSKILLYDDDMWILIYEWIDQLSADAFNNILPILRRTFSKFPPMERRQIGEKVREGSEKSDVRTKARSDFDGRLAVVGLPMALKILGLDYRQN